MSYLISALRNLIGISSVMALTACVQQEQVVPPGIVPAPTALQTIVLPGVTPKPGEPLALLMGGLLPAPIVIPMWLDLQEDTAIDPQIYSHTEATALILDEQRVYLEQSNLSCTQCSTQRTCRVLNFGTKQLDVQEYCIEVEGVTRRQLTSLGAGWFFASSEQEGRHRFDLIAWTSEDGSRELLRLDLNTDDGIEAFRDSEVSVILHSVCKLPTGCASQKQTYPTEPTLYRFTEADGLQEIPRPSL